MNIDLYEAKIVGKKIVLWAKFPLWKIIIITLQTCVSVICMVNYIH